MSILEHTVKLPAGIDLEKFVETAFMLSEFLGVGPSDPGPLLPGEARTLIEAGARVGMPVSIGRIKGREVNLTVFEDMEHPGDLYMRDFWVDHSDYVRRALLASAGVMFE